jgi:hypothetical protein
MNQLFINEPLVDHLAWVVPSVIALIGVILDHSNLFGSAVSGIWAGIVNWFLWVPLVGYGVFMLVRFLRNLRLHVDELDVKIETLLVSETMSRVAGDEALTKKVAVENETLRKDSRAELSEVRRSQQQLEQQVSELKKQLSTQTQPEPSPAELLAERPRKGFFDTALPPKP